MAELHKFQDDIKSTESRAKPIVARYLDDNFEKVKLKVADNLSNFIRIKENSPKSDEIEFVIAPPTDGNQYAPVFVNGQFSEWIRVREC